jgi:pimeloyl-ACP methyl ester carboxylesterase
MLAAVAIGLSGCAAARSAQTNAKHATAAVPQEGTMTDHATQPLAADGVAPESLAWAPDIPVRYVDVGGTRIRYIVTGSGPTLVLLHTLRTQLDMFRKVIPPLATRFRVYALDYPGHGHSDAPNATYDADFFVASVAAFLNRLDIRDEVLVGESIGGTIALRLAAQRHPGVRGVVAINPYDYDRGRGLRRSSRLANVVLGLTALPHLGEPLMQFGPYPIVRRILEGGVFRKDSFPPGLLGELHASGKRPGHARAFTRLVRAWSSWDGARAEYAKITVPVLLLYGDHDWSREEEREADRQSIAGVRMQIAKDAGHFLSLDAPDELVRAVVELMAEIRD